jgi:hypothetical protein
VVLTGTPVQNNLEVRLSWVAWVAWADSVTGRAAYEVTGQAGSLHPVNVAMLQHVTPPQLLSNPSSPSQEFYALLSFATPGVLGPMATFKRVYAGMRGRRTLGGIGLMQSVGSRKDGSAAEEACFGLIPHACCTQAPIRHRSATSLPPDPISRSQTKEATPTDKELGTARAA